MRFGLLAWLLVPCSVFAQSLAITDAVVYRDASATPLRRAIVLVQGNRIEAVGEHVPVPDGATVLRCGGCVVVSGFWNSHVHFTEPRWEGAARQPAAKLALQLQQMLCRSGFTTVVDTASDLANTVAIRSRVANGELPGPRILTAGIPIFPPDGIPYYVRGAVSAELTKAMTPPRNARETVALVQADIDGGADIIKLFTGSWITSEKVLPMPREIAMAAVQTAHSRQRLVFSHPSNLEGLNVAIASGVDVLAHAPEDTRGIDAALLKIAAGHGMTMIPTLKLFGKDANIADIRRVVREFQQFGGHLVFGTDTGYLTDYDVSEEFDQLFRAGLSWRDVLRMLTENPAGLFSDGGNRGSVKEGLIADLTVLGADPASDKSAFSNVRYTIRDGRVIWSAR
jgi:imidazolonepropionase-like amidohydrolase